MTARTLVLPLLVAALAGFSPREEPDSAVRHAGEWIAAVRAHAPGIVDKSLLDVAAASPQDLDVVRRTVRSALALDTVAKRNDVLRRGAILHMDLAILLPERAAAFTLDDVSRPSDQHYWAGEWRSRRLDSLRLVLSADGEYVTMAADSAHWWMASALLGWIQPDPSADPFVPLWYRAVAAWFESKGLFGSASYHLERALAVLPRDPILLFYAGALHEVEASPRIQSIATTQPALRLSHPSPKDEWRRAQKLLGASVKAGGPLEARVRYSHVLGRLGQHDKALSMLKAVAPELRDPRLQYFGELFLGSEEGALGHVAVARDAFERAAALYPTAQSPLLALGDLFRRAGNRAAALDALRRLEALPADPEAREDPWRDYFRSFAFDADDQLAAVRAWVDRKEQP